MKNMVTFLFILGASSLIYTLKARAKDEIIKGFDSGDAELIASFCNETSFLELFNEEEYEGKDNIQTRLDSFFKKHPPVSFKVRHQGGKEHKNRDFIVGILQCESEVFRITFVLKNEVLSNLDIIFQVPEG